MPRDLPIGNGTLLINFDENYQLRDIYFPRVGQENHTSGEQCRFGLWVDGHFRWLDDPGFTRRLIYLPDTLVTDVEVESADLGVRLTFNDTVDLGRDLLVRRVTVHNLGAAREIRLFFHYDWQIYGSGVGDTVMFYPPIKGLVAYKGQRYFGTCARVGERYGVDAYACGKKEVGGRQGTWRDAEDGELSNNAIEQGSVDMTFALHLGQVPSGADIVAHHWLIAARDLATIQSIAEVVAERGPEAFLQRTRSYWTAWVNKETIDFGDLPASVAELYRRSLLIIRTQVDNRGAIVAANDSHIVKAARDTYSYMWPRDAALTACALDQAGYLEVSRRFFELCSRIITEEGYFRHKYTPAGDPGSSWHPWVDQLGAPQFPIQEDETGLVLYALWRHYLLHRDFEFFKSYYRGLIVRAADFLARYLDPSTGLPAPSYDLWEERRGIMSFTVAAVWAGLQAGGNFAALYGETDLADKYRSVAAGIKAAAEQHLWDPQQRRFLRRITVKADGTISPDRTLDSSLYGLFAFGMFDADDDRILSTMEAVRAALWCKTAVGGLARYENDYYYQVSQDVANVPGNPWFICTMWYAQWLVACAHQPEDLERARDILEWVVKGSRESGVLAEQLDPYTRAPVSVAPLTWSHATVVSLVHDYLDKLAKINRALDASRRIQQAAQLRLAPSTDEAAAS